MKEQYIRYRQRFLTVFVVSLLLIPRAANGMSEGEIETIRKKVQALEKNQSQLYHSLKEKKNIGIKDKITEKISLGGLIEIEAGFDNNDKDGVTSDITLATLELNIDTKVNSHTQLHILFLWEQDNDPIAVDEGTITLFSETGFSLTAGKMYIPFGVFNSHFISDPLTLELGETSQTAIQVLYENDLVEMSFGIFNGNFDKARKDDKVDNIVASVVVRPAMSVSFGASYISDIADTNAELGAAIKVYNKIVAGYASFFCGTIGDLTVEAEYVTSSSSFGADEMDKDGDGKGDEPSAYNLEAAFGLSNVTEVAVKLEGNKDLFEYPEKQFGITLSHKYHDDSSVAFEYLYGAYDNAEKYKRELVIAQYAVEF